MTSAVKCAHRSYRKRVTRWQVPSDFLFTVSFQLTVKLVIFTFISLINYFKFDNKALVANE